MVQPLKLSVESVAEQTVTLKTPDGQILRLPADALHGSVGVGEEVTLLAVARNQEALGSAELARAILNELLGPSPA